VQQDRRSYDRRKTHVGVGVPGENRRDGTLALVGLKKEPKRAGREKSKKRRISVG